MNDIEIVKKSISKPVAFNIEQEDGSEETIYLKQFTVAQQARALSLSKKMKVFEDFEGEDTNEKMEKMDEETLKKVEEAMNESFDLLVGVVTRSIDGIDEPTAKEFVNTHFEKLMNFMDKLTPQSKESEKAALIEQRRKAQQKQNG